MKAEVSIPKGVRACSLCRFLVLLLAVFCVPADGFPQSASRKKVAVVLSGGGAKGMAHIGVLRVLERAGIPVDIVTGTSMGSLVGGLYAIGYTADQLDSIVSSQDWSMLLSDKSDLTHQSIDERRKQNTYVISRELSLRGNSLAETGGFIQGRNLSLLFSQLTTGYRDSMDFNRLPIPFACVATDIMDNSEVDWHSGVLAEAMRSSMSIPGAFAPVRKGNRVLVDGGLRNNFPVDLARRMGADYVIGVTLQGPEAVADDITNGGAVLNQIISVNCKNKFEENMAATDILIQCNTEGYGVASFFPRAVDTLIVRGEQAAMSHWDDLMELKRQLGLPADYHPRHEAVHHVPGVPKVMRLNRIEFDNVTPRDAGYLMRKFNLRRKKYITVADVDQIVSAMRVNLFYTDADSYYESVAEADGTYNVRIVAKSRKQSQVNLGVRADIEEIVAFQGNGVLQFRTKMPMNVEATLRLGKRIMARGELNLTPWTFGKLSFAYTFRHNDINIYEQGHREYNTTYNQHTVQLNLFDFNIRNFNVKIGSRFDYYNYSGLLVNTRREPIADHPDHQHLVDYHGEVNYDSENEWNFPSRGVRFSSSYRYVTSNFVGYQGHVGFSVVGAYWRMSFPLSSRLIFQPMVYGRLLFGHTDERIPAAAEPSATTERNLTPSALRTFVGGSWFSHYLDNLQQMPFAGVGYTEEVENKFLALQLRLQQRIATNNYILLKAASYVDGHDFSNLFDHTPKLGIQLAYYYNVSFLGPVGASIGYSTKTHKPSFYINIGYEF
ncbi:MAG: patatin-like phospholipase family protein [Prevotella sp.]|nr:patatin-like phospholipase family protein [Prevotella sp.]